MSDKIKVALIGAGGWGNQHARIFSTRPDVELCGIVGRTWEKTQARADAYRTRAYTDIEQMLDCEMPDFVSLCLPNQGHFAATLQIIEAEIPLLVEKPLTFDLDEADVLLAAAEKRDLFFAINFNHRYAVPAQKAKEAIEAGDLGKITFATWRFGGEGGQTHPYANLIETQCHGLDMLEFLCGRVVSVAAQMSEATLKGFSTMAISVQFESGAVGSLVGSYDSSYAYHDTCRVEVNGTGGRVLIHDTVRRFSYQKAGEETAEVWQAGYFNDNDRLFTNTFDKHMDAMFAAFKNSEPPPVPARAGRRALLLALAAIKSHETQTIVRV